MRRYLEGIIIAYEPHTMPRAKTTKPPATDVTNNRSWVSANWLGKFISLCALALSVYQGYKTREHDRLMVTPRMVLSFGNHKESVGWVESNTGLGPAIVNSFEVLVNGRPVASWPYVLTTIGVEAISGQSQFAVLYPRGTIPAETQALLAIQGPASAKAAVAAGFSHVEPRLVYCSIYDECWEVSSLKIGEPRRTGKRPEVWSSAVLGRLALYAQRRRMKYRFNM
jgi:hypothetical protein